MIITRDFNNRFDFVREELNRLWKCLNNRVDDVKQGHYFIAFYFVYRQILALFACLCFELTLWKWVLGDIWCWLVCSLNISCSVWDEDSHCCVCLWLVDDADASCDSQNWSSTDSDALRRRGKRNIFRAYFFRHLYLV